MSRKDYVAIAEAIKAQMDALYARSPASHAVASTAHAIADALAADNSAFDRDRFLKACGV